jgi:hypothetical protein
VILSPRRLLIWIEAVLVWHRKKSNWGQALGRQNLLHIGEKNLELNP